MTYQVKVKKDAAKYVAKMPPKQAAKVLELIEKLKTNPKAAADGPLQGFDDRYKKRIGNYRVLWEVSEDEVLVTVIHVGPRGDAYKAGRG